MAAWAWKYKQSLAAHQTRKQAAIVMGLPGGSQWPPLQLRLRGHRPVQVAAVVHHQCIGLDWRQQLDFLPVLAQRLAQASG